MKKLFLLVLLLSFFQHNLDAQWVQIVQFTGVNGAVMAIDGSGNNMFAGVGYSNNNDNGIYRSTNNGLNWVKVFNIGVGDIAISGSSIFATILGYVGIDSGIYRSTNNGTNWTKVFNKYAGRFLISGSNIYVGSRGVYLSTNNGNNWTFISNELSNKTISPIAICGTNIFVGTPEYYGIYRSSNNGNNWTAVNNGLSSLSIFDFAVIDTYLFVCTPQGVFRTTNFGNNWISVNNGLNAFTYRLSVSGTNLFLGTTLGTGLFLSKNYGANWIQKNQGFSIWPSVSSLFVMNDYIFAGMEFSNSIWKRSLIEIIGIKIINSNIPDKYHLFQNYPNPFNPSTNIRYALPKNSFVKLVVSDALGCEIETLVDEKQNEGIYEATFVASQYPSGVYFYTITAGDYKETKRMMLVK